MSGHEDTAKRERGRGIFLSAHRCPEVDVLPHQTAEAQILPRCSPVPADKSSEFTCTGESEPDYLDFCSTHRSEVDEEEEDEGSVSDWSEEDLSLHFSPSVLIQSDDETSDPESGFECVDITIETQVKGQDAEGLKMVPKRQIHLKKKKKDGEDGAEQVILKDVPAEGRGINNNTSANELLCPTTRSRPELLLRQHSMPTSFHATSNTSSDAESYGVYKGLIAGAGQGLLIGGNSQRLQKSFSLDETKTKMASCLIKNVLSKKMQVEQKNLKKNAEVSPVLPLGHQTGGGGVRAPVHVVRDVRSLVKHSYGHSFTTSAASQDNKSTSCKAVGQEDSPMPTYQQAVGVKGHFSKVAVSFSQSQDKKQSKSSRQPMAQQRRGSEPIISKGLDHLDPPTLKPNPSARAVTPPSHQGTWPLLVLRTELHPGPSSPHLVQASTCPLGPRSSRTGKLENFSEQVDPTKTQREREGQSGTATLPSQNQQELQQQRLHPQPILCSVPSLLPAQVSGDFLVDVLGSAAAPGPFFRVPAPCQLMLDPKSGQFFYADTSLQHQRKMLLIQKLDSLPGVLLQLAQPPMLPCSQ
uniref:uncharacterized protein LOC106675876 n=1 Tax=Maylandia zebra TaxID=106582 RepID=UPI000D2FA69E|nr:uncharacterized protein LOC106675876 [Maylandia zebra]